LPVILSAAKNPRISLLPLSWLLPFAFLVVIPEGDQPLSLPFRFWD
jgi:hypothetical protein